jgi:Fe-S cluster assembly protein SufB
VHWLPDVFQRRLNVSGFCKQIFRELPMEFAVEAQKLLGVSLEGSVG